MSMGKVKEALAALGELPPNLAPGERDDRICKKLKELGFKDGEIPSRRSLARYLDRLKAADATRPLCPLCHVHVTNADGMVAADDPQHEGDDPMEAEPRQLEEITQAVRQYLVWVPHDTAIDVALSPTYLRRFANMNIRPGDGLEWRSVDMTWIARGLVASVVKSPPTVTYKLILAPTFLMGHADHSAVHVLDQINEIERSYQLGKIGAPEYEGRLRILHALRDDGGRWPQDLVRRRIAELGRAHEAGLLSRPQHAQALADLLVSLVQDANATRARAPLPWQLAKGKSLASASTSPCRRRPSRPGFPCAVNPRHIIVDTGGPMVSASMSWAMTTRAAL